MDATSQWNWSKFAYQILFQFILEGSPVDAQPMQD